MTQFSNPPSNTEQIDLVTRVALSLGPKGFIVYKIHFDFQAFGSWLVEAGTPHQRFRIARDGRAGTVTFATASLQNASAVPQWNDQEEVPSSAIATPTDVDSWVSLLVQKHQIAGR